MTVLLYKETGDGDIKKDFDLVRQMRRAAISITSNIAEGFERQTQKEFIQFLFIAKGSVGELRSQLIIASELNLLKNDVVENLQSDCLNISKMLGNLIKYLKENNTK